MRRDLEGELDGWSVIAAFKKADGLIVHANSLGQLTSRNAALGAQDRQSVVQPFTCTLTRILACHNDIIAYSQQPSKFLHSITIATEQIQGSIPTGELHDGAAFRHHRTKQALVTPEVDVDPRCSQRAGRGTASSELTRDKINDAKIAITFSRRRAPKVLTKNGEDAAASVTGTSKAIGLE